MKRLMNVLFFVLLTSGMAYAQQAKYVFYFIGDGMGVNQVNGTEMYLAEQEGRIGVKPLLFTSFPVASMATTFSATNSVTDSSAAGTALATGAKTYNGAIGMDDNKSVLQSVAERAKKSGKKVGVTTSVSVDHATPAAFYAHQPDRGMYYEIALDLPKAGFDFYAGGGFLKPTTTADKKEAPSIFPIFEEAGYTVARGLDEYKSKSAQADKMILIQKEGAEPSCLPYAIDRQEGDLTLAEITESAISFLTKGSNKGFFLMVEGGKIDWACHANDAAATITDTVAMDEAVGKAVEFYNEHPDETLILVTGDHETGGLTIGFAGTDYDTFLANISNQKISYAKFDSDYVTAYKENKTDFDTVMADITELFGLQAPNGVAETSNQADSKDVHPEGTDDKGSLIMTDYEYQKLQTAYEETMSRTGEESEFGQEEYLLYGSYEPLTVTITHILNNKSGVNFASYAHTGLPVEVFAMGVGQDQFKGYYDNTDIFNKMAEITGVQ